MTGPEPESREQRRVGPYRLVRAGWASSILDMTTLPVVIAGHLNQAYAVMVPDAYILPLYDVPVVSYLAEGYVNVRDNPYSPLRALYNVGEWGHTAD